jgi:hypothetical protein
MNQQLPPIDARLREQLARRSEGRLPEGLLQEVVSGLDAVSTSRPSVSISFGRPSRRTSGALVGLAAVVALLAAIVAVPAFRNGPAASGSYPTDRALTTAELAALMAGPALATNAALVADVTIQPNPDVCPMDRYPTLGVVEGMRSQVCVMYQGLSSYRTTEPQSGVFAFRYLAPGVLGLIGEVTPASSRLSFTVAENWPLAGKTFIVDGWLGAAEPDNHMSCAADVPAGDVLSPSGDEPCDMFQDWLADTATPGAIASSAASVFANHSVDPIASYGDARLVKAGGVRQIDSISAPEPVHGEYVVRSATGPCPGASSASSVGCAYWLVLAKLADITPPSTATPTPTPTPAASPTPAYPTDRALTTAELGALLDSGALKQYDAVVVDAAVTAEASGTCQTPYGGYGEFAGFVAGIAPQTCVYVRADGGATTEITPGHLVLRVLGDRTLGYVGTVPDSPSGLAYAATDAWPDGFFLVHGWVDTDAADCGQSSLPAHGGPDPLFPVYSAMCVAALTATPFDPSKVVYNGPTPAGPPRIARGFWQVPADGKSVDSAPLFTVPASQPVSGSVEGTYLLDKQPHCSIYGGDCQDYYVLARLADVVPPPAPAPTPSPPATPTAVPTAVPTASTLAGYPAGRAMTTDELGRFLQTDGVKDKVVVANVTLGKANCPSLGSYLPLGVVVGLDSVCVVGIGDGAPEHSPAASSGTFALRVLDANTLGFMGDVSAASTTRVAYRADETWPSSGTFLATGYLASGAVVYSCVAHPEVGTAEPLSPGYTTCGFGWLSPQQLGLPSINESRTPAPGLHRVFPALYPTSTSSDTIEPPPLQTYLLRQACPYAGPCAWQIVAVLDLVTLPAAEATPTPTPAPTPALPAGSVGLWGSGDRPLTVAELFATWRASPTHLDGQIVVAKGPFPTDTSCWAEGVSCAVGGTVPEGYWVLQFDAQGKLAVLGELSTPQSSFVWTIDGVKSSSSLEPGDIVTVDGLLEYWLNFCDISRGGGCSQSWIVRPDENILFSIEVQEDAYSTFVSPPTLGGPNVRGVYLVRWGGAGGISTVLARLETAGSNP